jgi:hypothetical protein
MPRGKGIYDDEGADEAKESADQDRDAATTTEGDTPDVAGTDQEPTA